MRLLNKEERSSHGPNGRVADSLDGAKAAFRRGADGFGRFFTIRFRAG